MLNVLPGQHFAHIRSAGGVADHGGAAANKSNRLVTGHLQALHQGKRHEVPGGKAVGGTVKTDVKGCLAMIDHVADLILIGNLGNKAPGYKFFINSHFVLLFHSKSYLQQALRQR